MPATSVQARSQLARPLVRYVLIGVGSFAVDLGVLVALHGGLAVPLAPATAVAFWSGLIVNFALNRLLTFQHTRGVHVHFVRYLALVAVNSAVTVALVSGLTAAGLRYQFAKVVATALTASWNFLIYRRWIFT